jgi:hypothetical protein
MFPLKYLVGFGTNCIIVRNAENFRNIKQKKILKEKVFCQGFNMKNILEYSKSLENGIFQMN